MAKATKKNWEIAEMIMREYPRVGKYFRETEECHYYDPEKCENKNCKYCQHNDIRFRIPYCLATGEGYDFDGTPFDDEEPDHEIVELIQNYPDLFFVLECDECAACGGW